MKFIGQERRGRGLAMRALVTIAAVLVATALTAAFPALLAPMRLIFLWCAVLVSALVGGTMAGVAATIVCAGVAAYYVFGPEGTLALHNPTDLLRLALFTTFAGGLAVAIGIRRRAEERAESLSRWLATTLGSIGDAVIATDEQGDVVYMNAAAERLTGWTRAEATGQALETVFVAENETTREPVENPVRRVVREKTVVGLANHTVLVRRDGREIPIDDSAAPIVADRGDLRGVVLVFHDVSERRQLERARRDAEAELRHSERKYRTLVEANPLPHAVWTATADGKMTGIDSWLELTGQKREELREGGPSPAIHPDDGPHVYARWQQSLQTGEPFEMEMRVRMGDRYRWFAGRAVPVRADDGSIVEWVGVNVDVDEQKAQEQAYRFITRATEVLGASLDVDQTLRDVAKLCVPELGDWCAVDLVRGDTYERIAVEHRDPEKVALALEIDRSFRPVPDADPILQVIRNGQPQLVEHIPEELLATLVPNEEYLARVRALGLRSWMLVPMIARGRTLGVIGVVSSESDRRYDARDLALLQELARRAAIAVDNARLYAEAESANRAKDEFLATVSHELRTPLTAITGWAEMLRNLHLDDETRQLGVETILRSSRMQQELIDDLLDVSRIATGKLQIVTKRLDFRAITEEVVTAAIPGAEARDVDLLFVLGDEPAYVEGDDRRLRQVVWNLVSNAVKFTPRGGLVTVRLARRPNDMVRLEVTDTGRGIAESFLPHIWDAFRQADSSTSREYGGLGLGLAVVRHIVTLHHGTAAAASPGPGRGSTFTIELPLVESPEAVAAKQAETRASLKERHVLVIDDEQATRRMLEMLLTLHGATVTLADSADAGIRALGETRPDIILSDIAMPGEDGYSFARRARETTNAPMIAISAIASDGDERRRALDAGYAELVTKPFEAAELVALVARYVGT